MKVHWFHDWKTGGWEEWGAYTKWFYKCDCGARHSSFRSGRPESLNVVPVFVSAVIVAIGFLVWAYLYMNLYI